jgi:membrane protein implicated in regulation of membrane protease activity
MNPHRPPELEMTVDGEFVSPPKVPISSRILVWAIVVAFVAGVLSLAALALWVALLILPVALGAAVVAWAMFRYRVNGAPAGGLAALIRREAQGQSALRAL